MAMILNKNIAALGYQFLTHSPSNQIFPILPNSLIRKLEEDYSFYQWAKTDENNSAIRLVTSWATKESDVNGFVEMLKQYHKTL
jgi:threonine aldolase